MTNSGNSHLDEKISNNIESNNSATEIVYDDAVEGIDETNAFELVFEFLKVPQRNSLDCKFNFGFCVRIIIRFYQEPIDDIFVPEINLETGKVKMLAEIIDDSNVKLTFPADIAKSKFHSTSDFDYFIVPERRTHGEVDFLEGEYPLVIDDNGNYTYTIAIESAK
ncbi:MULTISPECIES: hypothetical protein [Mesonia]|uniref:Uncharacterized protein n=1 Tax=Mesonia oceanica TaxID=2687242 RepID=A0AC61Y8Z8_9FLAO|nr:MULTISPECIES: hypothetical protein [Mesonia]MAN27623.1 hypothetical protein [Mesonia sp.]MAQ40228.1 hypothetical protein [Mesonia sp.]MBJ97138.1 hypothetical protein [Flavobacteriaceae bacterium]VVV00655.1 hypothetical protein FVB9532_01928 [Mesonia oceanica]